MAAGRMEFHAESIMQHANFTFVLPNDVAMEEVRDLRHYDRETFNLILLHGLTGTDTDWLYGGNAQQMAIQYNLNIFMPTTGNSFYLDHGYPGGDYCMFIGKELPEYLSKVFQLDMKRQNTMIGGLSMGGYGAIHVALSFPETFSACIALSSAIHMEEMEAMMRSGEGDVIPPKMAKALFGRADRLLKSDLNPQVQYRKLQRSGQQAPFFYLACGTEDDLCPANRRFADFLKAEGADFYYDEGPGKHDWFFWNEYLERGLDKILGQ